MNQQKKNKDKKEHVKNEISKTPNISSLEQNKYDNGGTGGRGAEKHKNNKN